MGWKDILNGHINELTGSEEDLYKRRISICNKCPLYLETPIGPMCNPRLWINKDTGEISKKERKGYVKGCNCRLNAKTRLPNSKCIINKW